MEVFNFLSYINKISLLAFVVTTLVVAYQIYVLKKEKTKEQTPSIPNYKDMTQSDKALNYTSLPRFLLKKNSSPVNYSKLVFLIIFLLTIIVIVFILVIIRKNGSSVPTTTLPEVKISPLPSPTEKVASPSPTEVVVLPSPTEKVASPSPTEVVVLPSPTEEVISPTPTEIIVAQQTVSLTPTNSVTSVSPTQGVSSLPTTGSVEKGLLIIGVAISTIFFSFWF